MPDTTLEQFLSQYSPAVQELVRQARDLILSVHPGAVETVDPPSKIVAYGFSSTYAGLVCAIQPYTAYLNIIFSKGAALPDPASILTGTGKRARHARIEKPEDLDSPALREIIETAFMEGKS